eukprot:IDg7445t1
MLDQIREYDICPSMSAMTGEMSLPQVAMDLIHRSNARRGCQLFCRKSGSRGQLTRNPSMYQ